MIFETFQRTLADSKFESVFSHKSPGPVLRTQVVCASPYPGKHKQE